MPRRPNVTARSSLMCSDDMQMPSTPTFTMCSFLARAFSNQRTVRADDDGTCYGSALIDLGSQQFCLSPPGLTYSLNSPVMLSNVNCDLSLTRRDGNQNIRRSCPPQPIGTSNLLSSLLSDGGDRIGICLYLIGYVRKQNRSGAAGRAGEEAVGARDEVGARRSHRSNWGAGYSATTRSVAR